MLLPHVVGAGGGQVRNADLVQHINVKIFVANEAPVNLAEAVPVFHRWIREGVCPEIAIDVADYRHVPAGPGVMLICHEANYSLDNRDNRLGMLYNRKGEVAGTFGERLRQAHDAALTACGLLEKEDCFQGKLKFDRSHMEVFVNDRLLAPNTVETWEILQPQLQKFFAGCSIERRGEPRDLLRAEVRRN